MPLLEIRNVGFSYDDKKIFRHLNFSVKAGELLVISGPSGSGKSTLLRLFNRLQDPHEGGIHFHGLPLEDYPVTDLRRRIYYLQQTPLMIGGTVEDNLLLSFRFRSADQEEAPPAEELRRLLDRFQLADVSLSDSAGNLSLGQKQRVAFIRALLLGPQVLLLDEPVSSLDPLSRGIVEHQIESLVSEQQLAVLLVTHLDFRPHAFQARQFRLSGGRFEEF